jgi:putative sugar O-methyltransferase
MRPGSLDAQSWSGPDWSRTDRWLYTLATRLLWSYAAASLGGSPVLELEEPSLGHPFPVYQDGRLISQDLANTALELDAMRRGGLSNPRHILEVGAGYGRTAHALLSLHPQATYTIVDIEPAITISRWYLTQLFGEERITFVPADRIDELDGRTFDLGLSISSLQEMTPAQVSDYLDLFDRVVDGTVYLKQWEDWRNPVDHTHMVFAQYPFPARWDRRLWERCPVQTRFMQAVWRTSTVAGDPRSGNEGKHDDH